MEKPLNPTSQRIDKVLVNGEIYTGDRAHPYINGGFIAIDRGRIVAIGQSCDDSLLKDSGRVIDVKGAIVHPGMIDTHIHATSMFIHGLPVSVDQASVERIPYSNVKVSTDEEITSALVEAAAIALLRRGYTCFMEAGTVFETDAFASALKKVGMRGMVSAPFGWDDVSAFEEHAPGMVGAGLLKRSPADLETVMSRLRRELARNENPNELVTGYVCLYGEGSASDELIKQANELALESGVLFNQHQGFLRIWLELEKEKYGRTGIERLRQLGALGPNTTLSHMNVMTDDDAQLVVGEKPGITWCPTMAIQREVHPTDPCRIPSLIKSGVSVSLGMDTIMANPLGTAGTGCLLLSSMIGERLDEADPFYMQTSVAAKNIGREGDLGTIAVGKRADLVVRKADDITHTALDIYGSVLALSSSQIPVDTVIVDGCIVMESGVMTKVEQQEVLSSALKQRKRLLEIAAS